MGTPSPAPMGWPFLVASGRRRDYSILLAPGFLVADIDYGILDTTVRPTSETGPATVADVRTARGRRLTVVYATHLLTPADVTARDQTAAVPAVPGRYPRDEHGRPLRLIYGFASPDAWIAEPDEADLAAARSAALDTYRQFLADEERVTVTPSRPFPLRSRAVRRPTDTARLPARAEGSVTGPAQSPVGLSRTARWLVGVAIVAAIAVVLVVFGVGRHKTGPTRVVCPSAVATVSQSPQVALPSAKPTCNPTP